MIFTLKWEVRRKQFFTFSFPILLLSTTESFRKKAKSLPPQRRKETVCTRKLLNRRKFRSELKTTFVKPSSRREKSQKVLNETERKSIFFCSGKMTKKIFLSVCTLFSPEIVNSDWLCSSFFYDMKGSSGNIECSFSHTTEMFRSEARQNNSFLNTFLVCKCSSGQLALLVLFWLVFCWVCLFVFYLNMSYILSVLLSTHSNWQFSVYWLKLRYFVLVWREPLTEDLHEFRFTI